MKNLLTGGFDGPIIPVNPKHKSVAGALAYPNIASIPLVPDLAVICTPPATVPPLIAELAQRGTKGAIVITAGFGEMGNEPGAALQQAMLDGARPHLLRIVGPNCLGVLSTASGLNASFAPGNARTGGIAFVAQSGAMVTTMLDWANARGIGFSHLVSLGDMADVDFGDMLDYLANDPATTAVLLYVEAVTNPRKFLSAARAAARLKPVIAIKTGRHEEAAKAATSHTGAMAGLDAVYDAAFRRAGIVRVRELEELFDAAETLAKPLSFAGDDLLILTNGGGPGVLATDALIDYGGKLTVLSEETKARLDAVLPRTWSRANPIDIIGDAPASRYADALEIVLAAPETNAVLVINCPTAIASSEEAARAVARVAQEKRRPVLTNWLGAQTAALARELFSTAGLPAYDTPTDAARGFMHLVQHRKGQRILAEVPPSSASEFSTDETSARQIVETALTRGDAWLNAEDVVRLLECYCIPVARSATAATPAAAARIAVAFGVAVALKIASPDITHKSDVGGVALNLETSEAVAAAAQAMLARIRDSVPSARVTGFLVQEMIRRPAAHELIAGMNVDRQFGPVMLFGQGGTAAEIIADRALALPPLNLKLARELMQETRVFRQLQGYRDRKPADLDAIALTLVKLSQLICDLDAVMEVDLNPLLADADGVVVVDARIRLQRPWDSLHAANRLAIRPYPKELERREWLETVGEMKLRPIRPEDASALSALIADLSPEDARLRFFSPVRALEPAALARLTQIDYDREMAFVLFADDQPEQLLAVARLGADPDNVRAEYAVVVRSNLHRRGLGRLLMTRLIDYARARGLSELFGDVLGDNRAMLTLCRQLGFALQPCEGGVVRAALALKQ